MLSVLRLHRLKTTDTLLWPPSTEAMGPFSTVSGQTQSGIKPATSQSQAGHSTQKAPRDSWTENSSSEFCCCCPNEQLLHGGGSNRREFKHPHLVWNSIQEGRPTLAKEIPRDLLQFHNIWHIFTDQHMQRMHLWLYDNKVTQVELAPPTQVYGNPVRDEFSSSSCPSPVIKVYLDNVQAFVLKQTSGLTWLITRCSNKMRLHAPSKCLTSGLDFN